jgi:hypothetical protein
MYFSKHFHALFPWALLGSLLPISLFRSAMLQVDPRYPQLCHHRWIHRRETPWFDYKSNDSFGFKAAPRKVRESNGSNLKLQMKLVKPLHRKPRGRTTCRSKTIEARTIHVNPNRDDMEVHTSLSNVRRKP